MGVSFDSCAYCIIPLSVCSNKATLQFVRGSIRTRRPGRIASDAVQSRAAIKYARWRADRSRPASARGRDVATLCRVVCLRRDMAPLVATIGCVMVGLFLGCAARDGFIKDQSTTNMVFPPRIIPKRPGGDIPTGHFRPLGKIIKVKYHRRPTTGKV